MWRWSCGCNIAIDSMDGELDFHTVADQGIAGRAWNRIGWVQQAHRAELRHRVKPYQLRQRSTPHNT